jgi:single-strand DNA-binding protein
MAKTVTKVGNVTRDPELRAGESGKDYCRFGLAVDTPKEPGNWKGPRETIFYEVTCFDSLARNVNDTLRKGMRAIVWGAPELREWTDKEGQARTTKRINARSCGPELMWATASVQRTEKPASSDSGDEGPDEEPF